MFRDRTGGFGNIYERYRNVLIWKDVPLKVQDAEALLETRGYFIYRSLLGASVKTAEKAFEKFSPKNPKEVGVPNYEEALGFARECFAAAEAVQQHYLNDNARMLKTAVISIEKALVEENFKDAIYWVEVWRCAVIRMTWDECPDLRDLGWKTSGTWEASIKPSDI